MVECSIMNLVVVGSSPVSVNLNFRFRACFEQGVPRHSINYRVWIHYEARTWYDKNIQSGPVRFKFNENPAFCKPISLLEIVFLKNGSSEKVLPCSLEATV